MKQVAIKISRVFVLVAVLWYAGLGEAMAQLPNWSHEYYNLALGDVILLPNLSKGYVWKNGAWTYTSSGSASSSKIYHIVMDPGRKFNGDVSSLAVYQKGVTTTTGNGGTVNIVNQTDVKSVLNAWNAKAVAQGRPNSGSDPSTAYKIIVACNVAYYVLLDNVWSGYQVPGQNRMTGGLSFYPQTDGAKCHVYLKGDNRFGNIFYCSRFFNLADYGYDKEAPEETDFTSSELIFYSASSAGSSSGTLTVGNLDTSAMYMQLYDHNCSYNFYNSVIGGSDDVDKQDSRGIRIVGGTIFSGAQEEDVCSAIGGGGNGDGIVTVSGGTVTAVTSSTGTAIGGGIGWTDFGGKASVKITGGTVYAYNHGIVREYAGTTRFVPAAAIGGGSSFERKCWDASVEITGGTVYVQSVGGVAIGGGGSARGDGSNATIRISGGSITAKSISGSGGGITIPYGAAIGGGTGGLGDSEYGDGSGGNCTFTMTGGTLRAGSVGGGSTNSTNGGKIGFAKATISGSATDIQAQFIMAQGSSDHCEFTMSAGKLHNSSINNAEFKLVRTDGGALWLDDPNGKVNITGGTIENCVANNGGAVYTTGGTVTVRNATIKGCTASTGSGGAFAVMATGATVSLSGASITGNTANNSGGAFFLNNNATVSITNGVISGNTATNGDGGAFYGSPGAGITLSSGSIENNAARNGGGVYLANGAKLTYTMTANTGYIRANQASQWGGGVYLAQGTTSRQTNLTFTGTSASLGFYDNLAGTGADDIFAYGENTTYINFPNVNNMNLGGYSLPGATLEWWEDYKAGDARYNLGTQQKDASDGIRRYRASRDADLPIYKVTPQSAFYTKYLALTLGFEYGIMEIRRAGLKQRENAIYKVEFIGTDLERPAQYVTVLGTSDEEKTTIGGTAWNISKVKYLPKGTYRVTELNWTWYNTDKSNEALVKTQDITEEGVGNQIYQFVNDHKDLGTSPLHDEELKVNDLRAN